MRSEIRHFIDPKAAPKIVQLPGLETTILTGLHGEQMMVLNTTLPGHMVPTHSHPHEQIGMVYSGKALLKIGEEERIVQKGDFYCIPAGVPHSDTCLGDEPFVMLDIFYPVREDLIAKWKGSTGEQDGSVEILRWRKYSNLNQSQASRVTPSFSACFTL
jgi:quercetin dioxygenase-like cupin family protein